MRLAERWADGGVCTLREGEAKEYHAMCLAALREQEQRGWISLEDRLPEMKADVLMYFAECKNMAVGFMCDMDEDRTMWCSYSDDGWYTDCDYEPSHWMPLPEPPKED